MRKTLMRGAALLMCVLTATSTDAMAKTANTKCARDADIQAIQAAAMQQQLMVAGLSCRNMKDYGDFGGSLDRYNSFQTSYNVELRKSDKALEGFFRRVLGAKGEAEYHAFKTRAANNAQLSYIHDALGYCTKAMAQFDAALGDAKSTLAAFVSTQTVTDDSGVQTCNVSVPIGSMVATNVPLPKARPAPDAVIPAQGAGLSLGN